MWLKQNSICSLMKLLYHSLALRYDEHFGSGALQEEIVYLLAHECSFSLQEDDGN